MLRITSDVNTYIEELRAELAGADPAVIQDALYEAEEYLRSELAAPSGPAGDQDPNPTEALAAVIERYGTPRDVAAAYLHAGTESTGSSARAAATGAVTVAAVAAALPAGPTPKAPWRPIDFFTVMADPRTWTSFAYMLLSLATGIIYFTFVVTGISLSAGLSVLIIGVPFALLFLALVRALSLAEGRIVEVLLGVRMPRRPRLGPSEGGVWQRVLFWLKDCIFRANPATHSNRRRPPIPRQSGHPFRAEGGHFFAPRRNRWPGSVGMKSKEPLDAR